MIHMNSARTSRMLAEIAAAPVVAHWSHVDGYARGNFVDLVLPYDNGFKHNFLETGDTCQASAGELRVRHHELRRHGIGTRLTRALGALAAEQGYGVLHAWTSTERSLDIFGCVFGKDRVSVGDFLGDRRQLAAAPTSFDECRSQLMQLGAYETDQDNRANGYNIYIDLDGLDTRGWERPAEEALVEVQI